MLLILCGRLRRNMRKTKAKVIKFKPRPAKTQLPAVRELQSEVESVDGMIMRASRDRNFDAAKFRVLMEMRDRSVADARKHAFDVALKKAQRELPIIDKRGKIIIRDKADKNKIIQSTPYALWEDIHDVITPILDKHDLMLNFL